VPFAFRFGVVYLALFCLATQISGSLIANPWFTYRGLGRLWPIREITHWTARTVFGIDTPLDDVSGGETVFFWIQWSWVIAASIGITALWTLFDGGSYGSRLARRSSERAMAALPWLHLALRLLLAASLLEYGMTKVIPTQFPVPPLTVLVTPVGEMTLSALLWTTIGSAPAYQIITGCIEVLAGVLLLLPRTVTLGAVLGLVSLLQVLLLNLTFDIGVKLVTTHLIAMALILLAPEMRSLAAALLRLEPDSPIRLKPDSTVAPDVESGFSRMARHESGFGRIDRRVALLPIVLGVYLLGVQTWINWRFWEVGGGGRPTSVLYGIWNVERLAVDGESRPVALNDYDRRWRRVIFDAPDELIVQRTDDSFARYGASFDPGRGTIAVTKGGSRTWTSRLTFDRTADDRLTLDGEMDGHRIEAQLRLMDRSAFPLLNSSFRWIRPHDP
jgi:hypothetical protein